MYISGKMRPVETTPGMEERGNDGGLNSSMMCLIHCKNFYKCHMYPHPAQQ
jgi:hypothetical protein